ncbi:ABC transporter substrate-binding protein [Cohnella hongkongensis]|uniref:ABC transporter substrate-binding protein n=1 Tax=Cohnella hongkongensis TaxID=178337 RepID=A0ABV9F6I8_9BACL
MIRNEDHWEKELSEAPLGIGGFNERTIRKIKERVAVTSARKNQYQPVLAGAMVVMLAAVGWLMKDPLTDWFAGRGAGENARIDAWDNEPVVLKVQYPDRESFMREVGLPFVVRHPNAQFEIPIPPDSMEPEDYLQWIREQEPDLMQIPLFLVEPLAEAGVIQPLDAWVGRDGVELEPFHSPVIRTIREAGGGALYGLTPFFETYALYYNKSLFERFGVAAPQDRTTWKEALELASRFGGQDASGQPIYGLTNGWGVSPFELIRTVGEADGLRLTDPDLNPTIDSVSWQDVWERVIRGYREGWIFDGQWPSSASDGHMAETDLYRADPFLTGRAAMAFRPHYYRQNVLSAVDRIGFKDEWGIVTQPVSSDRSALASEFSIVTVFAVNANSPNRDAAWALLKFMTGPELAKSNRSKGWGALSTRLPDAEEESATGEAAFYKLDVDSSAVLRREEARLRPSSSIFIQSLQSAGDEEVRSALKGNRTLEQAMSHLQKRAEQLAASMRTEPKDGRESQE